MIRPRYALLATVAVLGSSVTSYVTLPRKLVWNASASTPIGLYFVASPRDLAVADLVVVDAPAPLAAFLAERGYLPKGVPLLKRILAIPGQVVCRSNLTITVDGIKVGTALRRDRAGRDLPVWQGCRRIPTGEVFLMNRQVPDSLDGRYFGLTSTDRIIGRAVPLCTDEHGNGRFEWRAPSR
ncbi:S26 family signal peptidase [Labrys okinawensis]|uniref:S26 family signal peptidase n=1 Tax=Labrys okinawensis TaxID=346911 RepID=UPI0039BC76F9